ncbi:response regulator [Natranaerobius thermophilus]|uniref:Stage 0 sporulation protein A homolog n=1 Tax=Natranaerobius thermophilus (strain ATCC BAA-1301 / DSM 18059 / JW/NM-WN-LF) TaxID=457570 RepID=B2A269_NATTJ|nr:response regulator [Natranaerobius thermophilus]ACB86177.1 response regulator receiver and SARP domain protein [Natranaerobius thermophilus JW/NM-WN-LF]
MYVDILILEVDYYTQKYYHKLVKKNRYVNNVYSTSSESEAIEICKDCNIDIALIDVELTNKNNNNAYLDAAKRIKKSIPDIEFIFITVYSGIALQSLDSNSVYYLVKPIKEEQLFIILDELVEKIRNKNQT